MEVILEEKSNFKKKRDLHRVLYIQVIFAIILGITVGHFFPEIGQGLKPLGDAFVKIIKMIIAPVIFLTVVSGIAGMKQMKAIGRIAGKAFAYFFTFSTLALIIGLIVANLVKPGAGLNIDPNTLKADQITSYTEKAHHISFVDFMMNIIPDTLVSPLVSGNILQVLFIAILFGLALASIGPKGEPIVEFINNLTTPIFKLVGMLMKFAPIGAFGAMAFTIGAYGIESLANLFYLILTFYVTALFFVFVILGAVAKYNGFSITNLLFYLKDELFLVFGTNSSEPALPSLMTKLEHAGCEKSVVGLVVPTGYSFNLDGTNIYMSLAALFIAQACNIDLSLGQQLLLLVVAMISSKGAAGVTGAAFVTLAAALTVVPAIPVAGMALILAVDRFMEGRALTNFIGNAVATIVVAKWDNALDKEKLDIALKKKV